MSKEAEERRPRLVAGPHVQRTNAPGAKEAKEALGFVPLVVVARGVRLQVDVACRIDLSGAGGRNTFKEHQRFTAGTGREVERNEGRLLACVADGHCHFQGAARNKLALRRDAVRVGGRALPRRPAGRHGAPAQLSARPEQP